MIEMVRRQRAAKAAMARFQYAPFVLGKNDCVRLAAFVIRKMGRRSHLAKAGAYKTPLSAKRALTRAGYADLIEAVDAHGLERIAPAAALPADLVMVPGEGPFGGALTMAVDNGRVLGWHQDIDHADVAQPVEYIAAWRTAK